MFYALSTNEDYMAERVNLFVALGPVTKITGDSGYMYSLAQNYDTMDDWAIMNNVHEIFPFNWKEGEFWRIYCTVYMRVCELIEYDFISHNPLADDPDRFRVYVNHEPNGTSF